MDPFVRRLVELLQEPGRPLSRNRHFHTFDNPEGRRALRVHRRLQALAHDLTTLEARGGEATLTRQVQGDGDDDFQLELRASDGRRLARLERDELELLRRLPGVARALPDSTG